MRASRLLAMVLLLQNRGRLSGPELARELEVSVRTVYRDIDALSAAGIPVVVDRGALGGFQLLDGYRTRLTGLSPDEAGSLFLAGTPGIAADLGLGEEAAMARLKLLAAVPAPLQERVGRMGERFLLDAPGWFHEEEALPFLAPIAEAVWAGEGIRWRYQSWRGESDGEVAPLGLVLKAGVWYVVAAVDGDVRTYRVARVLAVDRLHRPAERPAGFDLAGYWSTWSGEFNARLYGDRASIRLSPAGQRLLPHFLDAYRAGHIRATQSDPDLDGWVEAEVPTEKWSHAAMELIRFGREIEVLAPAGLRDAVRELALAVADRHATAPGLRS